MTFMTGADARIWPALRVRPRLYYGWVVLGVAALAMVGTLPGRTQGLGLITEPLLRDLGIGRVAFAQINLVATLTGALFCAGIGQLIDRRGSRIVLTATVLLLGAVVLLMSRATSLIALLVFVTLTRGFGQSALSVVSLAMVGKWFRRRLTWAMAVYALVMSVGFMAAFPAVGALVLASGWRAAWAAIGACLIFGLAPLAWAFDRSTPETIGLPVDGIDGIDGIDGVDGVDGVDSVDSVDRAGGLAGVDRGRPVGDPPEIPTAQATLAEALRSPAFWVFALASSVYGLVASGIGLFNESILAARGFAPEVYHTALAVTAITGLVGNFAAGAFADRGSLRHVLVAALLILTAALAALAHVTTVGHVMAQAVAMGIAGGFVMVVFFSFWGRAYGRAHLGRIQGAAQAMTVVASAVGPLFLALTVDATGSYAAAFYMLAGIVVALAAAAALVRIPAGAESLRAAAG